MRLGEFDIFSLRPATAVHYLSKVTQCLFFSASFLLGTAKKKITPSQKPDKLFTVITVMMEADGQIARETQNKQQNLIEQWHTTGRRS